MAKALALTLSNRRKQNCLQKKQHSIPVEMVMRKGTLNKDHVAQTCTVVNHHNNQNNNNNQNNQNCCFDISSSSSSSQSAAFWIAVYGTVNDRICFVVCEELAKATNKKLILHSFLLNSSRSFQRNTTEYHEIPLLPVLQ